MPRFGTGDAHGPGAPPASYLVMRRENAWSIAFGGQQFGPYGSEREALLFAVDAARKLARKGEAAQVLRLDEDGEARPVWIPGISSQ
jgi:hypothetical protein